MKDLNRVKKIADFQGNLTFSSVVDGSEHFVLARLAHEHKAGVLHIAMDDLRTDRLEESLAFFSPEIEVISIPAWDSIPYDRVSPNNDVVNARINALSRLSHGVGGKPFIVLTTVNAAIQKVISSELIKKASFSAKVGDDIKRDELTRFLIENGYINSGTASEPGEFATRGSIVDVFPSGSESGFRLDFFDTTIETIRTFDPLTQISGGHVKKIEIVPASEVMMNKQTIENFRRNYHNLFGSVVQEDPLYEAVSAGRKHAGMEHWLPLFYDNMESIFDYMPESAVITLDHLADEARLEREKMIAESYHVRRREMGHSGGMGEIYNPIPPEKLYLTENQWQEITAKHNLLHLSPLSLPEREDIQSLSYRKMTNFAAEAVAHAKSTFELVKEEIAKPENKCLNVIIACISEGSRSRMKLMLEEHDIVFATVENWRQVEKNAKSVPALAVIGVESGYKTDEVLLISEQDILGEKIFRKRVARKQRAEKFLAEASALMEGELVVHRENGIGRFERLETITVAGQAHDCLRIIYAGGDRLFVPVENIDMISRYGAGDETTQLDKLGAVSWQRRKSDIKNRIKVTADELLRVAAERQLKTSRAFHAPSGAYDEFCARFPYTETEDQQRCIEDVLDDLKSGRPMDRLICGDVGFGKTEVALRAAFVASHPAEGDEKGQVAIITPTTLLCRQHYQTFKKRFDGLGINIRQISRLATESENRKTREMIKEGNVDIVIGTHALLAKNIEFKNLALLIVDEEQHFGVAQKERLKKMRTNIHVLTLTATPIPRTLQLSLSGIRDLSLMTTPPIDRLAVRTYVMPSDPVILREAILREHYRGGRTFYVCPRIKDVEELEQKIKKLVPEIKVVAAHGQMPPDELDGIMYDFYEGKYDVLLSTTIIESGLDIPSANTIIIYRADMYGLAQLYQIRGRVGRGKVRAYAYLTLPPGRRPTKQAEKRLEVMQKLDTLGAGFSLASHDMDIRGFGNLLGDEQSGNIKEVGVELYQDMLREAVESIKSGELEEPENDYSTQINIGTSVLIPEKYVTDIGLRLSLYRRIAGLETNEEIESIAAELIDRFGVLPQEVENLLTVVKLKISCKKAGINKLDVGGKGAVIGFNNDYFSNPEALIEMVTANSKTIKIRGDQKLIIKDQKWEKISDRISGISKYIDKIADLTEKK